VTAPPRRRSYSQLDTYLNCPEQFYWKYVERVPETPAIWSPGGTAFHTFAERYLNGELGAEPTDFQVFSAWQEAFREALYEVREKTPDAPPLNKWRAADRGREGLAWWEVNGEQMCRRFIRWRHGAGASLQPLDHDGLMIERRIEVDFGGVPSVAIPDLVAVDEHGQVDIVDWKSGKPPKPSPVGFGLQLGVYKVAVEAATGLPVTWGLYYMTRPGALIPTDLTPWTADRIGELFADFDSRERAGDYAPAPGDHCKVCPFKKDGRCSLYKKKVRP
jgi:putative RecB family exonuclease